MTRAVHWCYHFVQAMRKNSAMKTFINTKGKQHAAAVYTGPNLPILAVGHQEDFQVDHEMSKNFTDRECCAFTGCSRRRLATVCRLLWLRSTTWCTSVGCMQCCGASCMKGERVNS